MRRRRDGDCLAPATPEPVADAAELFRGRADCYTDKVRDLGWLCSGQGRRLGCVLECGRVWRMDGVSVGAATRAGG